MSLHRWDDAVLLVHVFDVDRRRVQRHLCLHLSRISMCIEIDEKMVYLHLLLLMKLLGVNGTLKQLD